MKAFLFDTETTGLIENHTLALDKQPSVIEFFGCLADLKTGKIISSVDTLIKPPKPVSGEVTKITGLTNDDLANAPTFLEVQDKIFPALEGAPIIIAHNLSFDKEMMELEAERLSRKIKWPRLICTVEQTVALKGFRLSLSALHEHLFNETFTGAHRARVDVEALLRCCKKLHKMGAI